MSYPNTQRVEGELPAAVGLGQRLNHWQLIFSSPPFGPLKLKSILLNDVLHFLEYGLVCPVTYLLGLLKGRLGGKIGTRF